MTIAAVFTPYSIMMRSAASNLPFVGGIVAGAAALGAYFCRYQRQEEAARNRREFLRTLCKSEVPDNIVIKYQGLEDPIRSALEAIADPSTDATVRQALRAALAVSLH